jgi:hypothetical protein
MIMKKFELCLLSAALCLAGILASAKADEAKPLYENNFESAKVDAVPDDFLVLDGGFAVKEESGNKFLELPGTPLDSFGVLFGPTEKSDIIVSARIKGTKKGRRFPTFGVGLDGEGGYRLRVSPGKDALEIYKGDAVLASVPYTWKSGDWTLFTLQITKAGDTWKVAGKAWAQGTAEPAQPLVTYDETKEPSAGRASIWGSPYSTTPIQFDDLSLRNVTAAK